MFQKNLLPQLDVKPSMEALKIEILDFFSIDGGCKMKRMVVCGEDVGGRELL